MTDYSDLILRLRDTSDPSIPKPCLQDTLEAIIRERCANVCDEKHAAACGAEEAELS